IKGLSNMIKEFLYLTLILHVNAEYHFEYNPSIDGADILIAKDNRKNDILLSGTIKISNGDTDDISLKVAKSSNTLNLCFESSKTGGVITSCFDLNRTNTHWFGGPERKEQVWPLEEMVIQNKPWTLSYLDNFAVIEPYWLNSKGVFIHIEEGTPLWIDQNNHVENHVCFIANVSGPYVGRDRTSLNLNIGFFATPKEAHLYAVNYILGKPKGHPNEKMIREPIWTTWAKYKKNISDDIVLSFADDIVAHGYAGQLEIDDAWEKCYGAQEFSTITFPNITQTVRSLHEKNFRVTLWVHPFVDKNCNPNEQEGLKKGYFVENDQGSDHAYWWDSDDSHQIDFTKPEAQDWYVNRLEKLRKNHGIDSFKFDAGETDYVDQPAVYKNVNIDSAPNILSKKYIETCSRLGDLIEVRSSWKTQYLPIFVRMLDKDSNWGFDNGLKTLITTLLQMNLNGYVMQVQFFLLNKFNNYIFRVLPDMIGGNGYNGPPDAELLVRWSQANVFMPSMQFSYLPWEITSQKFNAEEIVRKTIDLHAKYSYEIINAMDRAIQTGTPVNPPIWWVDPMNKEAHKINDEFLLGESILVAPVVEPNASSRDVYLPSGLWQDGNTDTIYNGPIWIRNYSAPIDVLPYFINQLYLKQ
ncbi:unnamed protein product, partial [Brassicogethes aeneus]